jgi:hypothetical protein
MLTRIFRCLQVSHFPVLVIAKGPLGNYSQPRPSFEVYVSRDRLSRNNWRTQGREVCAWRFWPDDIWGLHTQAAGVRL